MPVLIKFPHGLGDAVQFSVVLRHLKKYCPDIVYDVVVGRGKHTGLTGLCRAVYCDDEQRPKDDEYNEVKTVHWLDNNNGYIDRPNTKVTKCLEEEFQIPYDPELGSYQLTITDSAWDTARHYLESIGCVQNERGKYNAVILHYEDNTSMDLKSPNHCYARVISRTAAEAGCKTILLDCDRHSPVPDGVNVMRPLSDAGDISGGFGSEDAVVIAALIDQSRFFIGIDSGPSKVASCTTTPTVIVWTGHHPLQFHDPAANTVHLIPDNHLNMAPISGNMERASFFSNNYRFTEYNNGAFGMTLVILTNEYLGCKQDAHGNLVCHNGIWVRADNFDQDCLIIDDVLAGDAYRTSLYDIKQWRSVVDVGAHIGCFALLVHRMNPECRIVCVEACPENIPALRRNVGDFATIIPAAMTYEPGELALLNAVRPNCESTGGSVVVTRHSMKNPNHPLRQIDYNYWDDLRPLRKITLEEAMREGGISDVSCLKLDCEGSEISILENAPSIPRVRFVFGEYHNQTRWNELRASQFSSWPYCVINSQAGRGVFQMINPYYNSNVPFTLPIPLKWAESASITGDVMLDKDAHRDDVDTGFHIALARLIKEINPKSILEIGVRRGHSGRVMCQAAPDATVTGIDNFSDTDVSGNRERARENLAIYRYTLIEADSQLMCEFPQADVILVDGDHSFGGALADITKACLASSVILIDDYYINDRKNTVNGALHWFLTQNPKWNLSLIDYGQGMRRIAVLTPREIEHPAICKYETRENPILQVVVPAGIGDAAWVMTKVPALMKTVGASCVEVFTSGSTRAHSYLSMLSFVRSVGMCGFEIVEHSPQVCPDGAYNYAPSQPIWHHQYDWLLQVNGHLERGYRIEEWFPDLETDWCAPVSFTETKADADFAQEFAARGPYVTIYAGPRNGNNKAGHNRGGKWSPRDWTSVAHSLVAAGIRPVVVGYGEGDADYLRAELCPVGFFEKGGEDCIDLWELPKTISVLKRAVAHCGYQSGLGVLSVYMGVPACMFWNTYGYPLNDAGATFREEMATAWVPPETLDRKRYLPAIYGRTTPEIISAFLTNAMWRKS